MENIRNEIQGIVNDARGRALSLATQAVDAACRAPMADTTDVDGFEPDLLRGMLDGEALPPLGRMKWFVDGVEYAPCPELPELKAQASLVAAILDRAEQDVRHAAAEILLYAALSVAADDAMAGMVRSANDIARAAKEGVDGRRLARQLQSLETAARTAGGDRAEIFADAASAAAGLLAVL